MSPAASASDALTDDELGESPQQLALAREIPGFGGVWCEPGEGSRSEGRIVLALTEAGVGDLPRARGAVLAAMGQFAPPTADAPEVLGRVVEHTFLEMAEHRARLRPHLFEMDEVVSLSVDEEFNRIKVGVTDFAFASAVEEVAADLGVPVAMLEIVRGSPVEHWWPPLTTRPAARRRPRPIGPAHSGTGFPIAGLRADMKRDPVTEKTSPVRSDSPLCRVSGRGRPDERLRLGLPLHAGSIRAGPGE